jgi:hypothetical protein
LSGARLPKPVDHCHEPERRAEFPAPTNEFPAQARKIPCPGEKNSLPRPGREFAHNTLALLREFMPGTAQMATSSQNSLPFSLPAGNPPIAFGSAGHLKDADPPR